MTSIYTYIARGSHNPEYFATFTIVDEYLKVNLSDLGEQPIGKVEQPDQMSGVIKFLSKKASFATNKLIEWMSDPVHIHDVTPSLKGDQFSLVIWKRVAGLKLAPMMIMFQEVDNPEEAELFIRKLIELRSASSYPNILPGIFDYWVSWIVIILSVTGLTIGLIKRQTKR